MDNKRIDAGRQLGKTVPVNNHTRNNFSGQNATGQFNVDMTRSESNTDLRQQTVEMPVDSEINPRVSATSQMIEENSIYKIKEDDKLMQMKQAQDAVSLSDTNNDLYILDKGLSRSKAHQVHYDYAHSAEAISQNISRGGSRQTKATPQLISRGQTPIGGNSGSFLRRSQNSDARMPIGVVKPPNSAEKSRQSFKKMVNDSVVDTGREYTYGGDKVQDESLNEFNHGTTEDVSQQILLISDEYQSLSLQDLEELKELRQQFETGEETNKKNKGNEDQSVLNREFQSMLQYIGQIVEKTKKPAPAKSTPALERSASKSKHHESRTGTHVQQHSAAKISMQSRSKDEFAGNLMTELEMESHMKLLTDGDEDDQHMIAVKQNVLRILYKKSRKRTTEDLETLGKFMERFDFFKNKEKCGLQNEEDYLEAMKSVKMQYAEEGQDLINQGDEGDRLFVLLAGQVAVKKAYLSEVPIYTDFDILFGQQFSKYYAWLSSLIDNFDNVYWHKVPYSNQIKSILHVIRNMEEADRKVRGPGSAKSQSTNQYENISNGKAGQSNNSKRSKTFHQSGRQTTSGKGTNVNTTQMSPRRSTCNSHPMINLPLRMQYLQDHVTGKLIQRLESIQEIFDFGHLILNEYKACLQVGTCFGELALLNPKDARLASIETTEKCILAYIEKHDWTHGLNRIKQDKLFFLRGMRIFRDVSSTKLLSLRLRMDLITMVKGQRLYEEGDEADGIYLIRKGVLKYMKNVECKMPMRTMTKNHWSHQQVVEAQLNRKVVRRDVATFTKDLMIGNEEIFREFILKQQDPQKHLRCKDNHYVGSKIIKRDFTCECVQPAEVLFLKSTFLQNILRMHDLEVICYLFRERRVTLQKGLEDIEMVGQIIEAGNPANLAANEKRKREQEEFKMGKKQEFLTTLSTARNSYRETKNQTGSPYQDKSTNKAVSPQCLSSGVDLRHLASSASNDRPFIQPGSMTGKALGRIHTGQDSSTVIIHPNTQQSKVKLQNSDNMTKSAGILNPRLNMASPNASTNQNHAEMMRRFCSGATRYGAGQANNKGVNVVNYKGTSFFQKVTDSGNHSQGRRPLAQSIQLDVGSGHAGNYKNIFSAGQTVSESKSAVAGFCVQSKTLSRWQKRPDSINNIGQNTSERKMKVACSKSVISTNSHTIRAESNVQLLNRVETTNPATSPGPITSPSKFVLVQDKIKDNFIDEKRFMTYKQEKKQQMKMEGGSMKPIKEPLVFGNQSVQTFDARKVMSERNQESLMESGQGLVNELAGAHSANKTARKADLGELITELPADDPSSLYLRDAKYFMSLRNAQINFKNRREMANQAIVDKKAAVAAMKYDYGASPSNNMAKFNPDQINPADGKPYSQGASLLRRMYKGQTMDKVIYDGLLDVDPNDYLRNDLSMKLLSVFQSIDVSQFYRRIVEVRDEEKSHPMGEECPRPRRKMKVIVETEKEQKARLKQEFELTMAGIDKILTNINKIDNERKLGKVRGEAMANRLKARNRRNRLQMRSNQQGSRMDLSSIHAASDILPPGTRQSRLASAKQQLNSLNKNVVDAQKGVNFMQDHQKAMLITDKTTIAGTKSGTRRMSAISSTRNATKQNVSAVMKSAQEARAKFMQDVKKVNSVNHASEEAVNYNNDLPAYVDIASNSNNDSNRPTFQDQQKAQHIPTSQGSSILNEMMHMNRLGQQIQAQQMTSGESQAMDALSMAAKQRAFIQSNMNNSPNTAITLRLEGQKVTIVTDDTGAQSGQVIQEAPEGVIKSEENSPLKPMPDTAYLPAASDNQKALIEALTSNKKQRFDVDKGGSLTHDDGPSALNESNLSAQNALHHMGLNRGASPELVDTGFHTRLGNASRLIGQKDNDGSPKTSNQQFFEGDSTPEKKPCPIKIEQTSGVGNARQSKMDSSSYDHASVHMAARATRSFGGAFPKKKLLRSATGNRVSANGQVTQSASLVSATQRRVPVAEAEPMYREKQQMVFSEQFMDDRSRQRVGTAVGSTILGNLRSQTHVKRQTRAESSYLSAGIVRQAFGPFSQSNTREQTMGTNQPKQRQTTITISRQAKPFVQNYRLNSLAQQRRNKKD